MSERIPLTVLDAAHLKLCRQVAALLLQALSESGIFVEEMCARIEMQPAEFHRYIHRLTTGKTKEFRSLSDLCCAMDVVPVISMQMIRRWPDLTDSDLYLPDAPEVTSNDGKRESAGDGV